MVEAEEKSSLLIKGIVADDSTMKMQRISRMGSHLPHLLAAIIWDIHSDEVFLNKPPSTLFSLLHCVSGEFVETTTPSYVMFIPIIRLCLVMEVSHPSSRNRATTTQPTSIRLRC